MSHFRNLALGGVDTTEWTVTEYSPDGKWAKTDDNVYFSITNLDKALAQDFIEVDKKSENTFRLTKKGKTWLSPEGVTIFTSVTTNGGFKKF